MMKNSSERSSPIIAAVYTAAFFLYALSITLRYFRWQTIRPLITGFSSICDHFILAMLGILILYEAVDIIRLIRLGNEEEKKKRLQYALFGAVIFGLMYYKAHIFKLPLLVYFSKEISFNDRVRICFYALFTIVVFWFVGWHAGWLSDFTKEFTYGYFRSYGAAHTNTSAMILFFLYIAIRYLYFKHETALAIGAGMIVGVISYKVFGCRTVTCLSFLMVITDLLSALSGLGLKKYTQKEMIRKLSTCFFVLMPVLIPIGMVFIGTYYLKFSDPYNAKYFSRRFVEIVYAFQKFGLSASPRVLNNAIPEYYFYFDSTFSWLIYNQGLLCTVGMLILMCTANAGISRYGDEQIIQMSFVLYLYAIMERLPEHALFIVVLSGISLWQKEEREHEYMLKRRNVMRILLIITYAVILFLLHRLTIVHHMISYTRYAVIYFLQLSIFGCLDCTANLIWDEFRKTVKSHICFFLIVNMMQTMTEWTVSLCVNHLLISALMMLATLLINRGYRILLRAYLLRRVMIIGGGENTAKIEMLYRTNRFSMSEVTAIAETEQKKGVYPEYHNDLLKISEIDAYLDSHRIDEVILALSHTDKGLVQAIYDKISRKVSVIRIIPEYNDTALINDTAKVQDFDGTLLITASDTSGWSAGLILKRLLDIIAGCAGILLCIPAYCYIRIVSWRHGDHGPVIFRQKRIGKNGQLFTMYKFRSMVENAEEILKEMVKDDQIRGIYEKQRKLENDPRITYVGKKIRRTSLDELPQLINVLTGEMSLVGPRPYLPEEKEAMGNYYDVIIQVKPGMTGLWQTHGRSSTTFARRLIYDQYYVHNWTIWMDITILIRTIKVVLKKEHSC